MDTVYTVHLRSYGFLHPGRERMRQVLKRAWPHIPGSTLYGVIAAALIQLAGPAEEEEGEFQTLLGLLAEQKVRFLPLIVSDQPVTTAAGYCLVAMNPDTTARLFQAKTHAPLSRTRVQAEESLLYAYGMHRPILDYYGFVVGDAQVGALLRRGLRLLPLLPVGGKGKFSLVEGEIVRQQPRAAFEAEFSAALSRTGGETSGWVRLLTPMLMEQGEASWLLTHSDQQMMRRLRRYRIWQSGQIVRWPEPGKAEIGVAGDQSFNTGAGHAMSARQQSLAAEFPGGQESRPATGIPEGSRFHIRESELRPDDLATMFVEGTGHAGWRCLGWGQMVMEWVQNENS